MQEYTIDPTEQIDYRGTRLSSFISNNDTNVDQKTIESFGQEWNAYHSFDDKEIQHIGNEYFDIVTEQHINQSSTVLDVGCGTGRWARYIAQHVKHVEAIDPSSAIYNAIDFNHSVSNIRFTRAGVDCIPFEDNTFDLVFSLGVLHHIPDTQKAMQACVDKVKPNGHFLVYLYYNFDNRGIAYKALFQCSNGIRRIICKLPFSIKKGICSTIGIVVYWPLARVGTIGKKLFPKAKFYKKLPLYYYHDKSLHIMKNDALDRFGTPLEQRFTKKEILTMMHNCGLDHVVFSESTPYWHAIGRKVN